MFVLAMLVLTTNGPAAAQTSTLPLRNLVVEVRQTGGEALEARQAGVGGGVVVGTGGVSAQGGVQWRSDQRGASAAAVQQVLVLNGGQAGVRVAAQTPWQFVQVAWVGGRPSVAPTTLWTESAAGVRVRPRWPGGTEPVTVELSAEGPLGAAAPSGSWGGAATAGGPNAAQAQVLTTVQVPLGEWVTVARRAQAQRIDERGVLSTGSADRRSDTELQVRVLAP
jgi:hypothetical protein